MNNLLKENNNYNCDQYVLKNSNEIIEYYYFIVIN